MKLHHITALCGLALAGAAHATTLLESGFDSGAEGWTSLNGASPVTWFANGGQSGGYIRAIDEEPLRVWVFSSPTSWAGDLSAAIGGTISWSLRASTLAAPMAVPWADVKIGGAGLVLAAEAGDSPGLDWTSYTVSFTPGAWRVGEYDGALASAEQIAAVLSNLEFVRIRGEFSAVVDGGSLDSVAVSAVPELPTAALALAGIALLALRRRRAA